MFKPKYLFARFDIPQANRLVIASREQMFSVGSKRDAGDFFARMLRDRFHDRSAGHIAQNDLPLLSTRGDLLSIRRESDTAQRRLCLDCASDAQRIERP